MKRMISSFNTKRSSPTLNGSSEYPEGSPENIILNGVTAFCESRNTPDTQGNGTEFVHLPAIVESAESSPSAAKEAAHRLRKYLSDPIKTPGYIQYNAIQLFLILINNPGHTFTRNIDAKFVSTVKDLIRDGRDMGAQHILRETLDVLEAQQSGNEDLAALIQMWKKEKLKRTKATRNSTWRLSSRSPQQNQPFHTPRPSASTLPPPEELANRITEAKTSAKLLIQFVQSTPPTEFHTNELISEFYSRCQNASRAIQNYIHSTHPAPDEETLLTLIETNDELSVALSKYQRSLFKARKLTGHTGVQSPTPSNEPTVSAAAQQAPAAPIPRREAESPSSSVSSPTPPLAPTATKTTPITTITTITTPTSTPSMTSSALPGPASNETGRYEYRSEEFEVQNPFADKYSTTISSEPAENLQINGTAQR